MMIQVNRKSVLSAFATFMATAILLSMIPCPSWADPVIADHSGTDIFQIPETAILAAKAQLHIAYGHTSHGSQLTTGMSGLVSFMDGLGYPTNLYAYNSGGTGGALDLRDTPFSGAYDLGNPDRVAWATATRNYLNANPDVNVVIWSWCGQVSGATEADITTYLTLMNDLEIDYPNVKFVYMTGHLDGSGETGNLNQRNQQIRDYCIANDKILYDFADIESYDPDGLENYMPLAANDNCDYDSDGDGSRESNWAIDWQNSHVEGEDWYSCSSAHSQALNANRKAYAAWWLWARLADWNECLPAPGGLTAVADSGLGEVYLQWSDASSDPNEDNYIIQRRVDGGDWDNAYLVLLPDVLSYTDTGLLPGSYEYRVVAQLDDDGTGTPCNSQPSAVVTAQIVLTQPPDAPNELAVTADSASQRMDLSWNDNSENEDGFVIQRRFNTEDWEQIYAQVGADSVAFADTGLVPGLYTYRVIAVNSYGQSSASNEAGAELLDIPMAPTLLTATSQPAAGTIALAWQDNADGESGFIIDRQVDGGDWQTAYAMVGPDTTVYIDVNDGGGALSAGTYTYRVCAYNAQGTSVYSNSAQAAMSYSIPDAPFDLQSSLSGFDVNLTWIDASDNEVYFLIERQVDAGDFTLLVQLDADNTSYTDTGLTPSLTYGYRVHAVNAVGASDYSNETSQYIPLDPITIRLEDDDSGEVVDAFLSSTNPDTNYGSTPYLSLFERFIIKFNLPSELENKRIVEAQLYFYGWSPSNIIEGEVMDLYRVTQPWDEATVTWNQADSITPWQTAGADFDPEPVGHIPFDGGRDHAFFPPLEITELTQAWGDGRLENHGLLLIDNSPSSTGLKASEYSDGHRTYLQITYEPCIVDRDGDGDVDGADLAAMALGFDGACLGTMAENFGH